MDALKGQLSWLRRTLFQPQAERSAKREAAPGVTRYPYHLRPEPTVGEAKGQLNKMVIEITYILSMLHKWFTFVQLLYSHLKALFQLPFPHPFNTSIVG